jgi:hypothetical protein
MGEKDNELIVAKVAEELRDTYARLRSHYCTFPYVPRESENDRFIKAAKLCILYRIRPREFIEVSFKALRPYPFINQLTGQRALNRFMDAKDKVAKQVVTEVLTQMSALEKLLAIGRSVEELFTDTLQNFDPLFKYVVSRHYGMEDMASVFYDDAIVHYSTASIYLDEAYKDLIPEELKAAVGKVRRYANG